MNAILYSVCAVLGLASLAFIAALSLRRQFADFHELVRRTPPLQRTLLALLAAAWIAYGGGKTNQVEQTSGTNGVAIVAGGTNGADGTELNMNEIMSCSRSLEIVARSDDRIEVSNVDPDSFTVVWPVEFAVAEGLGAGKWFHPPVE